MSSGYYFDEYHPQHCHCYSPKTKHSVPLLQHMSHSLNFLKGDYYRGY